MRKAAFFMFLATISFNSGAANVAPSRTNPGDFPVATVPQFVCIGADDNFYPDGFQWLVDYLRPKRNKSQAVPQAATFDGTPARMSFYVNTNNGGDTLENNITRSSDPDMQRLVGIIKQALADGHEIGCHTKTHNTELTTSLEGWITEIDSSLIDFDKAGIGRDNIVGFRTPFLAYSDNTFQAVAHFKQLRYDCSILSGLDAATDGTNFVWPYTLDNGAFSEDAAFEPTSWETGLPVQMHAGRYPGLWEIPVYCAITPPSLRDQIKSQCTQEVNGTVYTSQFDVPTGKVTGMDYNLWSGPSNYGGLSFDSAQFVGTLKHSLDLRLSGNRAPLAFCVHSNIFYDTLGYIDEGNTEWNGPGAKPPRATVTQMRNALIAFIDYALSIPDVRFVTQKDLIHWCENPVALSGSETPRIARRSPSIRGLTFHFTNGRMIIGGLDTTVNSSVSMFSLSGKALAQTVAHGPVFTWNHGNLEAGSYILRLKTPGRVDEARIFTVFSEKR